MAFSLSDIFKSPDNLDRMSGVGSALIALGQGRGADVSQYRDRIEGRAQDAELRKQLSDPKLLERFTPEQRQMLAAMPPAAAQQLIAETVFAAPPAPTEGKVVIGFTSLSPTTLPSVFAAPPAPTEGKVVGDRLVNPITGEVIFEAAPQAGWKTLTPDEAAQLQLPPGAYQMGPDGKIATIGGGGQTINIGDEGSNVLELDNKTGRALIADPTAPDGMRWVNVPGGQADIDETKEGAASGMLLDNIDALLADPGLDQAVGTMGAITGNLGPLAPEAARAKSRIDQLRGQVFLEAYSQLKGSGQITEIEGAKAENALARLQTNLSPEDFRAALLEFRTIIEGAMSRPPGWTSSQGGQTDQPGSAPRRLTYNPQTGELE